jgi:hypothetical protein
MSEDKDDEQDHVNQPVHVSQNSVSAISEEALTNRAKQRPTDRLSIGSIKVNADGGAKPTISAKRAEANRQNSRKSTGPRTAAGKKRVSRNAIRHGFFSKWLLVQHPDAKESLDEYEDFYADIRAHYQPADWLEHLWVEKIAVWSWRLRRLIRCESGQIARALAGHSHELQQTRADDLAEPESAPSSNPEMDAMTDHLFLPEKDELDKLLRYEAMINRQLNHAIGELERLQARWKG